MRDHALLDRIQLLLVAPPAANGGPSLDHVEDVLTEGYAEALALEAERWRLERRLGEVAAELAAGERANADEFAALATRMSAAGEELLRLRSVLASLQQRVSEARAA